MEHSGKLKIVDELDPSQNTLDVEGLTKFLSEFDHTFMDRSKPKRPDYFVIDNFARYFKLDDDNLLGVKQEVKKISDVACADKIVA